MSIIPAVVGTAQVGYSQIGVLTPIPKPPSPVLRTNFTSRIFALLPQGWFSDAAQAQGGVLWGLADGVSSELAYLHATYLTLRSWTRIRTATGAQLDAVSSDFYGSALPRKTGEGDPSFLSRIIAEFFTARGTRPGIAQALTNLTGDSAPIIFEPWNAQDTKGWSVAAAGWGIPKCAWGNTSTSAAYVAFVTPKRPLRTATNATGAVGWSSANGGWSSGPSTVVGTTQWLPIAWLPQVIVDADILALMARTHALGTRILTSPY